MDDEHPTTKDALFGPLPLELAQNLRSLNPWWSGRPLLQPHKFRRWPFNRLLRSLKSGMAPATVLRGPRRVGKTILLTQTIEALLSEGVEGNRILYVPIDELPTFRGLKEPVLAISRWFEQKVLEASFKEMANRHRPAYLFLDEVQNLDAWAPQVKNLVDNQGVRVLITGSSSLRIEAGRDSLAGRVTTLEMGPLLLREIAGLRFGFDAPSLWGDNGLDRLLSPDFWQEARSPTGERREMIAKSFLA
ncbi:MAG TPA: AAA family ATPase, partial [Spirochaetia bacterium]